MADYLKLRRYLCLQKQSSRVFCKNDVLQNFAIFTGKHQCWILFSKELQVFRSATKRGSDKFLLTLFLIEFRIRPSLCVHQRLRNTQPRRCLYEKNHPNQMRCLTWMRSRQNRAFQFVKINCLYENRFIPPRRSHFNAGKIYLRWVGFSPVNSFSWSSYLDRIVHLV